MSSSFLLSSWCQFMSILRRSTNLDWSIFSVNRSFIVSWIFCFKPWLPCLAIRLMTICTWSNKVWNSRFVTLVLAICAKIEFLKSLIRWMSSARLVSLGPGSDCVLHSWSRGTKLREIDGEIILNTFTSRVMSNFSGSGGVSVKRRNSLSYKTPVL